jgi:hypothetical protein
MGLYHPRAKRRLGVITEHFALLKRIVYAHRRVN